MKCYRIHCQEPWFSLIRSGKKTVEGRKNSPFYQQIRAGDIIEFHVDDKQFQALVIGINRYSDLPSYLIAETVERALPGVKGMEEALAIYYRWNNQNEINNIGFLGIQVEVIKDSIINNVMARNENGN